MRQSTATPALVMPLLAALSRAQPHTNIVVSPASIAFALMMAMSGARGETRAGIATVLGLDGLDESAVDALAEALRRELHELPQSVEISVANALWSRADLGLSAGFLDRLASNYEAAHGDLAAPDALEQINAWAARETGGAVRQMLDTIDPLALLVLVNAICFKAAWTSPFSPDNTADGRFRVAGGLAIVHPRMAQVLDCPYLRAEGYCAVGLPYGDGRLRMNVFLPDEDTTLPALVDALRGTNLESVFDGFRSQEVALAMPRLEFSWGKELNDALQALGMAAAFDLTRANFDGMFDQPPDDPVCISRVVHQAHVLVNEEGTEAAAATAVEFMIGSAMTAEPPVPFIVDRPFLFLIGDARSGSVLFAGTVNDPSNGEATRRYLDDIAFIDPVF